MKLKLFKEIVVAGGGRWSREILITLNVILSNEVSFTVITSKNYEFTKDWCSKNFLKRKIKVFNSFDYLKENRFDALIVANSASDHFQTASLCLCYKIPILVEKPLTTTLKETQDLIKKSETLNNSLYPSNVFLFNDYLENYKKFLMLNKIVINKMAITWFDKKNEMKKGELKKYDSSVPIYLDCMHHICSILSIYIDLKNINLKKLIFKDGGANISMNFLINNIEVLIKLGRERKSRVRKLEIQSIDKIKSILNFTKEPGYIKFKNKVIFADDQWDRKKKPLQNMIECFLDQMNSISRDKRFNLKIACFSAEICEKIGALYKIKQNKWLKSIKLSNLQKNKESAIYSIKERNVLVQDINGPDLIKYIKNEQN